MPDTKVGEMNALTRKKSAGIAALAFGVVLILIVAGGGVLQQITPASAATSTSVSITIPGTVVSGSNFTATVNITQVANFDAANYDISFDPTVLRLDGVTNGNIGGKVIPIEVSNQISPGIFRVVANVPGFPGVSGSGYLSVLRFSVIGSLSTSTSINLSNGVLGNNLAVLIPATWSGALIQAIPAAPTVPASFSISNFSVAPRTVGLNEPATVSALVTNTGGSEGTYPVILKVNGVQEAKEDVILGGGQIRTVSFTVARGTAGRYAIDVNGKADEFTVAAPLILQPLTPPPAAPTVPNTQTTSPPGAPPPSTGVTSEGESQQTGGAVSPAAGSTNTPAVATASPPLPPPAPSSFSFPSLNWLVIGGIGGAVIVIGLFIFLRVGMRM